MREFNANNTSWVIKKAPVCILLSLSVCLLINYLVFYSPIGRWTILYGILSTYIYLIVSRLSLSSLAKRFPLDLHFIGSSECQKITIEKILADKKFRNNFA